MLVRELEQRDFEAWLPLWHGYQEFYETEIPEAVTRLNFDRLTDKSNLMGAFVAEGESGALVGMVHWITHRSTWTEGDYCYLQDLFVEGGGRGQGIGRALIETVYDKASQLGCNRVYWLTHETNTNAMVLYDRMADRSGFIQYRKIL